jgi:uncharacterized protein GlcG (DUF336 family)
MQLPGFRSNRSRPDAPPGRPRRSAGASRLAVERLEIRSLMDGSSAGHPPSPIDPVGGPAVDAATAAAQLTPTEVNTLLERATAADPYDNAIIAVVDRGGRVLGVRVDSGVSTAITGNASNLVFAVDGAIAEARTGAFFASDQAPLTSRTVENLSQSTMTQRLIQSNPSITDPNSTLRGPGFVAPVGIKGHFPPGVPFTPPVDLSNIEATNRDSIRHPVANGLPKSTANDVTLPSRFNVPVADIPASIVASGTELTPPESYGFISGLEPDAQARGIGTLPGGLPIERTVQVPGRPNPQSILIGGIGVFYPGTTGYATEENSQLNDSLYDPKKPDLSEVAEGVAAVAIGGSTDKAPVGGGNVRFGFPSIDNIPGIPSLDIRLTLGPKNNGENAARIDLVGITLDVLGPHGISGPTNLVNYLKTIPNFGMNNALAGTNLPISNDVSNQIFGLTTAPLNTALYPNYTTVVTNQATPFDNANQSVDTTTNTRGGRIVPDGWLVTPHAGDGLSAQDVINIVNQGIYRAVNTRAAIRLPIDRQVRMVFAVSDKEGDILGLYREPDATVFSIDVAVAKARNVAYYANPAELQPIDKLPTVPAGTALTNRTFRYLSEPRFPEGIDGQPPGPFSVLTDGGSNPLTAVNIGAPLPASAFQSVEGYDDFNPQTNFHDPFNPLNQDGIVFFPGSVPLYTYVNGGPKVLAGGLGVSGDGVDQDDDVTFSASLGYRPPPTTPRADQVFVRGVRLPYQKFNRNPKT